MPLGSIRILTRSAAEKSNETPELVRLQTVIDAYDTSADKPEALHSIAVATRHGLVETSYDRSLVLYTYLEILVAMAKHISSTSISHIQFVQSFDNAKTISAVLGVFFCSDCLRHVRMKALEALKTIAKISARLWPEARSMTEGVIMHMRAVGVLFPSKCVQWDEKIYHEKGGSDLLLLYGLINCAAEEERVGLYNPLITELDRKVKEENLKSYERKRVLRLASEVLSENGGN